MRVRNDDDDDGDADQRCCCCCCIMPLPPPPAPRRKMMAASASNVPAPNTTAYETRRSRSGTRDSGGLCGVSSPASQPQMSYPSTGGSCLPLLHSEEARVPDSEILSHVIIQSTRPSAPPTTSCESVHLHLIPRCPASQLPKHLHHLIPFIRPRPILPRVLRPIHIHLP